MHATDDRQEKVLPIAKSEIAGTAKHFEPLVIEQKKVIDLETSVTAKYDAKLEEKIEKKKSEHTYRVFRVVSREAKKFPYGQEARPDGDSRVSVWCSNDYLGMSHHNKVQSAVAETLYKHGAGAGGTRSIAGTSHYHVNLEKQLAELHRKEAALLFTSCYVANDTTLQTLSQQLGAEIYSDSGNHASIIAGIKNSRAPKHIFKHNSVSHLDSLLSASDPDVPKIVAFESVYSMTGTMSPIGEMCDVAHKHGALTFVDEVHAVGLYGANGAGLGEELGLANKIDIVSGTLGKAYGLVGGYIAGSGPIVDTVRSFGSGLIFTTSIPPMIAAGASASVKVLASAEGQVLRGRHRAAVQMLKSKLIEASLPVMECQSHIVPVFLGDANKVTFLMELLLKDHNIYVQAIISPTVPKGSELLRFVATPFHTAEMIDYLVHALDQVWNELEIPRASPAA